MKKVSPQKIFGIVIIILMGVQIAYGFHWMITNITGVPTFGDTTEYLQLSESLALDEYRPILYPLFLRHIIRLCKYLPFAYQSVVYLIQSILCYFAIWYVLTYSIGKLFCHKKKYIYVSFMAYISLYIMCIPMISFMNFSILTDSLANSFLLIALGAICRLFGEPKAQFKSYIVILISMLLEYLTRADRLYSCSLFLIIVFGVYLIKKRGNYVLWKTLVLVCVVFGVTIGGTKLVNHFTQHPGLYGRIQTNFEFILLDRIVWPNMSDTYNDFPDEIRAVITPEEAAVFDNHNNNVMYQMAPSLESRVGAGKAHEYYRVMAKIVLKNYPIKVIGDITEDIVCVIFTPVSALLSHYGLVQKNDNWNLACCSNINPELSKTYYRYYLYSFNLLLLICGLWLFLSIFSRLMYKHKQGDFVKSVHVSFRCLLPHFLLCILIALWFSIGDGAPPNDRYALLHYVVWAAFVLGAYIAQGLFGNASGIGEEIELASKSETF